MSNIRNSNNLLKGIGCLLIFIVFGYFSYQDSMNQRMLEKSLNNNASPPHRNFSDNPYQGMDMHTGQEYDFNVKDVKSEKNAPDIFNEYLDEYLEDPEDEISYPPEIFDALQD